MPQYFPPLNVCFTRYLESCHHPPPPPPSPFANILDLLQGRTSLKIATSGPALHIILCTDTCRHMHIRIHAHTETDACISGMDAHIM